MCYWRQNKVFASPKEDTIDVWLQQSALYATGALQWLELPTAGGSPSLPGSKQMGNAPPGILSLKSRPRAVLNSSNANDTRQQLYL